MTYPKRILSFNHMEVFILILESYKKACSLI